MDLLPLKWEAARRAIDFWVQVMRMDENRLVHSENMQEQWQGQLANVVPTRCHQTINVNVAGLSFRR